MPDQPSLICGTFAPWEAALPKELIIALISVPKGRILCRAPVAPDGSFEIATDRDIQAELKRLGVPKVSLAVILGDKPLVRVRGKKGPLVWPVSKLPLLRLKLRLPDGFFESHVTPNTSVDNFGDVVSKLAALAQNYARPGLTARGDEVGALQRKLRAAGLHVPEHELAQQVFGAGTRDAVAQLQARRGLAVTGEADERTLAALENTGGSAARIEGRLRLARGAEADGVTLRAYRKGFGGAVERVGEATTDAQGYYSLPHGGLHGAANVEVRAVGADGEEVKLSTLRLDAEQYKLAELVAPDAVKPPAAEYHRLTADVARAIGSADKLGDAREDDDRQDLTFLHHATQWDARLLALGALAAKSSKDTGIRSEALYALYRTGLPSEPAALAKVGAAVVEAALSQASSAGVVALDASAIAEARAQYETFARAQVLTATAPGALASMAEILDTSGMTRAQQETFSTLYFQPRASNAELWDKAREAGLPVERLKLQGTLGFLTLNSSPVMASLLGMLDSRENLHVLADRGLHRADAWKAHLTRLAGDADVAALIPPAYTGETAAARLDSYANDLARKVRVAYPTRALRWDIANDQVRLGEGHATAKRHVGDFLERAVPLGFELGERSVEGFARDHAAQLFAPGDTPERRQEVVESVKTLQRLYQISPSDAAMEALYTLGFKSSYEIASIPEEEFVARYASRFASVAEARAVHNHSRDVTTATLNIFDEARRIDTTPSPAAMTVRPEEREVIRQRIVRAYPTLERLFGPLDYCECAHCRSVLSPAAYLVDLLQFIDPDDRDWASSRGRKPGKRKPATVLFERRPDLGELPLTCENTHTTLPYIDLVNEILEDYVTTTTAPRVSARDTGRAKTEDLLAEPQTAPLEAAYDRLKTARYPEVLPFDLWTETLRRFLAPFDLSLARLLDVYRREDAPFGGGANHGHAAVFLESLGLSAAEQSQVFAPPAGHPDWWVLYGKTAAGDALALADSARDLSRNLAVTYKELTEIIQKKTLNPDAAHPFQLVSTDASCDFSKTKLRRVDGSREGAAPSDLDLLRLVLFVRVWRKLGWTIAETDRALVALTPATVGPASVTNLHDALRGALVHLAHVKTLAEELRLRSGDRARLLGLWEADAATRADARQLLATALKLTDEELTALQALSGLDPAALRATAPFTQLVDDKPFTQTRAFVRAAKALRARGFAVADMDYLCRHTDPRNVQSAAREATLPLAQRVAAELERVESEYQPPADPLAFSDERLQKALDVVFAAEIAGALGGLFAGTLELKATHTLSLAAEAPFGASGVKDERLGSARYDAVLGVQSVTVRGVVLEGAGDDGTDGFLARYGAPPTRASAAQQATLRALLADARRQALELITAHLGFLAADFNALFAPVEVGTPNARQTLRRARRELLLRRLLPWLRERIKRQTLTQSLAAHTGMEASAIEALVFTAGVLPGALDALQGIGKRGVDAFWNGASSPVEVDDMRVDARTRPVGPAVQSVRFEAWVEAPADGSWRLYARLGSAGASVTVSRGEGDDPEFTGTAATDGAEFDKVITLRAASPEKLTVTFTLPTGGDASVEILGQALPRGPLARLALRPASAVTPFRRAVARLEKIARVVKGLALTAREVRHFASHGEDFAHTDATPFAWSRLPADPSEVAPSSEVPRVFGTLARLFDYASLRDEVADGADDLIGVFELARRRFPAGTADAVPRTLDAAGEELGKVTHRPAGELKSAHDKLGFSTALDVLTSAMTARGFTDERGLRRLVTAVDVAAKLGVPVSQASDLAKPEPSAATVTAFRDALRARRSAEQWRTFARPIYDGLRQRRRDALAAHVQHTGGFENRDSLYEYFLLDPGMEPVVQTSRVRLAIASVQLFIQRCLLNLEPEVHPAAIDAKRWEWMKRYRVWEANRKIYLYCENWLEPELRDDKTHLFTALEGQLLQGDVSQDSAEDAFFEYLKKLEGIARLDIVTTCLEDPREGSAATTLHVVGRTFALPRKYYYRRYDGQEWTPWEPVDAEIEGDHVSAVVWRDRLQLFWVTFMDKAEKKEPAAGQTLEGMARDSTVSWSPPHTVEAQLNWTERFQGKWAARGASGFGAPIRVPVTGEFNPSAVFIHVTREEDGDHQETSVTVHLSGGGFNGWTAFRVISKNAAPEVAPRGEPPATPYFCAIRTTTRLKVNIPLVVRLEAQGREAQGLILNASPGFLLTPCSGPVHRTLSGGSGIDVGAWVAPFFCADATRTFYVEPTFTETTTIDRYDDYVLVDRPVAQLSPEVIRAVAPQYAAPQPVPRPLGPGDPPNFKTRLAEDWITNPNVGVRFGDVVLGARGGLGTMEGLALRASLDAELDPGGALTVTGGGSPRVITTVPGTRAPAARG